MTHPRLTLGVAYSPTTALEQSSEFDTFETTYSLISGRGGIEVPLFQDDSPDTTGFLVTSLGLSSLTGDSTNRGSHRTQGELDIGWRQNFLKYFHIQGQLTFGYGNEVFNVGRGYEPPEELAASFRYSGILGFNVLLPDGSDILPQIGWFFEHDLSGSNYKNHGIILGLTMATNFLGGEEAAQTQAASEPSKMVNLETFQDTMPKTTPDLEKLKIIQQQLIAYDKNLAEKIQKIINEYSKNGVSTEGNFQIKRLNLFIEQMLAKDRVLGFPIIIPFPENHPDLALQPLRADIGGKAICLSEPRLDILADTVLHMAKNIKKGRNPDGKNHQVTFHVTVEGYARSGSGAQTNETRALALARAEGVKAYLVNEGRISHLRDMAELPRNPELTPEDLASRLEEANAIEAGLSQIPLCVKDIDNEDNYSVSRQGKMTSLVEVKIQNIDKGETALLDAVIIQLEVTMDGRVLKGKERSDFLTDLIGEPNVEPKTHIF